MQDNYRHQGMRKRLIAEIERKGIHHPKVLEVMSKIPRHFFMDRGFEDWAYKDVAFPIGEEQTISQPYTVAYQTQLLEIQPKDRILEIGTGSGYQAAVLFDMGAKVYTIERQEKLFVRTEALLKRLGYGRIRTFLGDGFAGLQRFAPFDKILLTAAPEGIPGALLDQLDNNGILVTPIGETGKTQQMVRVTKVNGSFEMEKLDYFQFVPMLKGVQR
ncbi:protein-L-isoaspartate(D-aspartate) O-methyltransferase [Membranihabitans marinus]|uniref:protein-L-isoaspartate(D-aspartate) O-methyltransferase n=1 Tax=Membranihabitans marinus TaxID=1227546 RepID=UPI001F02EC5B|nr:protein-L-isoaspartate(D-aspartate) O-methyltransferase [Membranihabitans marinus]